jgi:RHS repeat-associated protein
MTQETRSIVRAGGYDSVTAVTGYESDYLGRMQHVSYPDGETVTYTYDAGGNVQTVTGVKEGYDDFKYVKDIGYDEYGQRVYISYGNGTHTTYTYDPARRWLKSLVTESEEDGVIQNMQYTFDTVGNVEGYTNSCKGWSTSQDYTYDSLYQLIKVEGSTENKYATADRPSYNASYSQTFAFSDDGLCNMTGKTSKESEVLEDDLNYTLAYTYDSSYAHRAVQAGKRYYKYDANGNLIREQDKSFADTDSSDEVTYHLIQTEAENVYSTDYAWARMKGGSTAYAGTKSNYYYRDYTWNERNLLSKTKDDSYTTEYLYGGDGQRAVKRSSVSETLYFNKFFTQRYDDAYQGAGGRMSKHIFLGNDRIVTKQVALGTGETYDNADTAVEKLYTYYYHADHLGSTSVVTDHNGEVYERLEYTPYGETWLDETNGDTYFDTPYRFSAKEKDEETGLYYYGARYLDPKYSRWISADPALGDYLPQAPVNDEAKKHNQSLPGQGGVFNVINLNLYHYAGNNPIKYTDPDGCADAAELEQVGQSFGPYGALLAIGAALILDPTLRQSVKDGIVATGNAVVSGAKAIASAVEKVVTESRTKQDRTLYHYSTTPPSEFKGTLKVGSYLTPNGDYSSKEAGSKLALPIDSETGKTKMPLYKYTFDVKEGEYGPAPNSLPFNIVKPANGKLGLGTEFVNTVPLVPAKCDPVPQE